MAATKNHTPVMGRLLWDASHPSPWMSFEHVTAFRKWSAAIRKSRPGTKTEWAYYDMVWTADMMLRHVQHEVEERED
jgi:hypothetical protein